MSEILFSTTAFLQFLGLHEEAAFWVVGVVIFCLAASLIVGMVINIGTREQEGED